MGSDPAKVLEIFGRDSTCVSDDSSPPMVNGGTAPRPS
jgi:hypothetical protein